jgi:hypothetical protein
MVAAAYTGILKFNGANGRTIQYRITASDVANEYFILPSGDDFLQLPLDSDYFLTDVILSAAGTDTTRSLIYANQKLTPEQIANSANLATNVSRQFMGSPIGFKAGTTLKFQQVA